MEADAAARAGSAASTLVKKTSYKNTRDAFRQIFKSDGIAGFYRGFWTSYTVIGPSSAIWWSSYTTYKKTLYDWIDKVDSKPKQTTLQKQIDLGISSTETAPSTSATLSPFVTTVAAASSGLTAMIFTYPMDVARTRIQTDGLVSSERSTLYKVISTLIQKEGWSALYKGVSARCIQTSVVSIGMALCYEHVKKTSALDPP